MMHRYLRVVHEESDDVHLISKCQWLRLTAWMYNPKYTSK
jgi:hypothetical protein